MSTKDESLTVSPNDSKLLVSRCFSSYAERYDFEKEIVEKILSGRQYMSTVKRKQIVEIVVSDFIDMFIQNNG